MTTHRVYLRWRDQTVNDRTTTESAEVAAFAFNELKERPDLAGKEAAVLWTRDGHNVASHRFNNTLSSISAARDRLARSAEPVAGIDGTSG